MKKWKTFISFVVVTTLLCSLCGIAYANPGNNNHENGHNKSVNKPLKNKHGTKQPKVNTTDILIAAGISYLEARHFAESAHAVGYKGLPPGIQKNLMRGKPLPPGIAKKMIPGSMLSKLPKHPGYDWRIAGKDLVLIHMTTQIVSDVLHDVFQ